MLVKETMSNEIASRVLAECDARKSHLTEDDLTFLARVRSKIESGEELTPREHRHIGAYLEFIAAHAPDAPPA